MFHSTKGVAVKLYPLTIHFSILIFLLYLDATFVQEVLPNNGSSSWFTSFINSIFDFLKISFFVILAIIVLLLAAMALIRRGKNKAKEKYESKIRSLEIKTQQSKFRQNIQGNISFEGNLSKIGESLRTIEKHIISVDHKTENIKSEIQSLYKEFKYEIEKVKNDVEDLKIYNKPVTTNHSNQKLHFVKPDQSGYFETERSKEFNEENKSKISYRISINTDENTGILEYLSSIKDKSNVDHRDMALLPACEITNPEFHHVSKVEMIEPGTVSKEGNSWKVEQKVKVTLK